MSLSSFIKGGGGKEGSEQKDLGKKSKEKYSLSTPEEGNKSEMREEKKRKEEKRKMRLQRRNFDPREGVREDVCRGESFFFLLFFILSLFFFFAKKSKQTCCNTVFCVVCTCVCVCVLGAKNFTHVAFSSVSFFFPFFKLLVIS